MSEDPDAPDGLVSVIEAHRAGGESIVATYLGRAADCADHAPGVPHAPCWMISRGATPLRFRVFKSRDELAKLYGESDD